MCEAARQASLAAQVEGLRTAEIALDVADCQESVTFRDKSADFVHFLPLAGIHLLRCESGFYIKGEFKRFISDIQRLV